LNRLEPETLLRNHGQESRARFKTRIVEFPIAGIAFEVLRVLWRQERAFMMVEPPGDLSRGGVLEVDDGILVADKVVLVKQGSGAMQQAHVFKLDVVTNTLSVKAREKGGGAGSIKTAVVIKDANVHSDSLIFLPLSIAQRRFPSMRSKRGK